MSNFKINTQVSCQDEESESGDEVLSEKVNDDDEIKSDKSSSSLSSSNNDSGTNIADGGLKQTVSQAMMNSNLLNSLPKYIFQSEHSRLKSVTSILKEVKEQQSRDAALQSITDQCEVSEYPIEFYENQQHAIERHMSIK
jgi:hypothetical protein